MTKIMFVCHGNICRSPMAEFVFLDLVRKRGLEGRFFAASSAVSTEEIFGGIGNPVYPPARAELKKQGIPFTERRAVQLKRTDYEEYDLFVCMDSGNVRGALRILGSDPYMRVCKLMDFTDRGGDVADPWYSGRFDVAFRDIKLGCTALLEHLLNKQQKG